MPTTLEGKTVLIVEDDPDMLAALRAVLGDTGATIETAMDGNAAIEVATETDPDLIVLDRNLFEIDPSEISDARVLMTLLGGRPVPGGPAAVTPTCSG